MSTKKLSTKKLFTKKLTSEFSFAFFCLALCLMAYLPRPLQALDLAQKAPNFTLNDELGKAVTLSDYKGKIVVLEWFNSGCPFVKKHYKQNDMVNLQDEFSKRGVVWMTINSTAKDHRDFMSPDAIKDFKEKHKIQNAIFLTDSTGEVGKSFGAKTTPHLFVVNEQGNIAYRGAIDDSPNTEGDPKLAKNFVRSALEELLSGKKVTMAESESYGCGVKYAG